ncbi:TetR/AcrR family transcriptional regulator [Williamsia sterculiae]|uniref:Transcriptional regulator, TetR family n=1 Tax=Williamsia sterculiae TaxID=1344003 RepID=A0A1N7DLA0_9NOCA|nr:helix-turn-helix domain-containing protein [Williamsia sterculiae]SIR76604.1 transcriptional regulator, TetR family [Williamsia sterculiae]
MTGRAQLGRGSETRARILDATIDVLVQAGYARTTTQEVTRRSGVSRGAQLHHFPTRESLVIAAVSRLVDRRLAELVASAPELSGLDVLLEAFSGPLFDATLEVWVAARTDSVLRAAMVPLEQTVADKVRAGCHELFGEQLTAEQMELSVEIARGLAVSRIFRDEAGERAIRARLLPAWESMVGLSGSGSSTPMADD